MVSCIWVSPYCHSLEILKPCCSRYYDLAVLSLGFCCGFPTPSDPVLLICSFRRSLLGLFSFLDSCLHLKLITVLSHGFTVRSFVYTVIFHWGLHTVSICLVLSSILWAALTVFSKYIFCWKSTHLFFTVFSLSVTLIRNVIRWWPLFLGSSQACTNL